MNTTLPAIIDPLELLPPAQSSTMAWPRPKGGGGGGWASLPSPTDAAMAMAAPFETTDDLMTLPSLLDAGDDFVADDERSEHEEDTEDGDDDDSAWQIPATAQSTASFCPRYLRPGPPRGPDVAPPRRRVCLGRRRPRPCEQSASETPTDPENPCKRPRFECTSAMFEWVLQQRQEQLSQETNANEPPEAYDDDENEITSSEDDDPAQEEFRSAVENHINVAKKLQELLEEQLRCCRELTADDDRPLDDRWVEPADRCSRLDSVDMVSTFGCELDAMREQVDELFGTPRFECAASSFREVQLCSLGTSKDTVDITNAHVVPFPIKLVANAAWQNIMCKDKASLHESVLDEDTKTYSSVFVAEFCSSGRQGKCRGKLVSRRYEEDDREVITWIALMDPTELGSSSIEGVLLRHRQWMIIRHPKGHRSGSRLTQIQSRHVVVEDHELGGSTAKPHPDVTSLLSVAAKSIECHLDATHLAIENIIMDHTTRARSHG